MLQQEYELKGGLGPGGWIPYPC